MGRGWGERGVEGGNREVGRGAEEREGAFLLPVR